MHNLCWQQMTMWTCHFMCCMRPTLAYGWLGWRLVFSIAYRQCIVSLLLTINGQPGQKSTIMFQIGNWCRESHPLAITSAFAQPFILGYMFIKAFQVGEVHQAVDGLLAVCDKQPKLIAPTKYSTSNCSPAFLNCFLKSRVVIGCTV